MIYYDSLGVFLSISKLFQKQIVVELFDLLQTLHAFTVNITNMEGEK